MQMNKEINLKYDETYMQQEEESYLKQAEQLSQIKLQAENQINQRLMGGTIEDKKQLLRFCLNPENAQIMNLIPELSYFQVAMCIFREEIQKKEPVAVIDGRSTIEQVNEVIHQIKFFLWEIEFDISSSSIVDMQLFLEENHISQSALNYCIQNYCINQDAVMKKLSQQA